MKLSRPSLKNRTIAFFFIAILASTLLGGYLLNYYSDEFTEDISRRNLLLAHQIHHNIQLFLDHHVSELRELRLAINKYGLDSIGVMKEELDRINAFHPLLGTVQILDVKGIVRHISPYDVEDIDIDMSGHDSFQNALDLSDQGVYWSDSFISSNTNDPSVTISLPINDGVLMAQLNLKVLSDIVSHPEIASHSEIVSHPIPYGSLIITITDSRGVVIAHPDQVKVTQRVNLLNLRSIRRAMDGEPGTYSETWDGNKGLTSVVLIPESGWVVTVFQGEKEALGIVIRARKVVMVAIAFLLGLTMLAFMFLQRQGMKPFRKLEEKADLIATGSYGEDLEAEYLEFSGFVDSFNEMTRAVRGRELELKASEERFRILFDEAAEPVYLMDSQADIIAANKRAEQALGYTPEELNSMNVSDFIVGETREIVSKRLGKITGDEAVTAEGRHQRKDGTVFSVETRIARMETDGEYRFIAHARDISARKKAEEALKASEEKFRLLADNAIDVIWTMDLELKYMYISPSITNFRGITVQEALAENRFDAMTPDTGSLVKEILEEEMEKEKDPDSDSGRSRTFEGQFIHKNGSLVWGEVTSAFLRDQDGEIIGIQGVTRDISERKKAEEELRLSEERFRTAFITSPDAISISSMKDGSLINVNEAFSKLTGWGRDEVIGKTTNDLGFFVDKSFRETAMAELALNESLENLEAEIRTKDGRSVSVLMSASIYVLEDESHILTVARDISELKEAQSSLREAYHLMSTIIDSSPLGVVQTDRQGVIHLWNPAAERIFGWKNEEVMNKLSPTVPAEKKDEFTSLYERVLSGESLYGYETRRKRKDGTLIDVSVSLARILLESGEVEVLGIVEDITDKKAAENSLRESEERLQKISEGVFEGIVITEKGVVIESNNQIAEMLGYDMDEIVGKDVLEFVAPEWKEFVLDKIKTGFEGRYEHESVRKDGIYVSVEVQGTNTTYQGKTVRVSSIRDITDQKRAENVLKEREKRYRLLYDNNPLSYQSLNDEGVVNEVNSAWLQMTGYENDDVIGKRFIDFISDDYKDVVRENFPKLLERGEIHVPDLELVTSNGKKIHVALSGRASVDEDTGLLKTHCLLQDITERTRMEQALKKGAQLAAVGQVASGIAHEINNPLATISASTEALLARLPLLREAGGRSTGVDGTLDLFQEYLTMIMDEVSRSSQIIRDLLNFSRVREYSFNNMDVMELATSTVRLLSIQSRMEKHEFQVDAAEDIPLISADRDRLRQVLIILLTNAVEAMPDGGKIDIVCGCKKSGDAVFISVKDSGTGISLESLDMIFEPFYTTKGPGGGTGLGLSIADTIVVKHNGRIETEANPGGGTIITVTLPITQTSVGKGTGGKVN